MPTRTRSELRLFSLEEVARYLTAMIRLDRISGEFVLSQVSDEEALAALKVAVASALNPQDGWIHSEVHPERGRPRQQNLPWWFPYQSRPCPDKKAGASPGSGRAPFAGLRCGGPPLLGFVMVSVAVVVWLMSAP